MENKPRKPRNYAATKLKAARLKSGLSQAQLSEKTGINMGTLRHYEQGSKQFDNARFDTIFKTCVVLDCQVEDLIENEDFLKIFQKYNEKKHS